MSELLEQFSSAERIYRLTYKSALLKSTLKQTQPREVWDFETDSPEEDSIDSIETSLKNTSIADSRLHEAKNLSKWYVYLRTKKFLSAGLKSLEASKALEHCIYAVNNLKGISSNQPSMASIGKELLIKAKRKMKPTKGFL